MLQKALGRATLAREISHGLQLGAELLIQAREQVMLVAQGLLRLRAAHADAFLEVLETLLSHVSVRSLESRAWETGAHDSRKQVFLRLDRADRDRLGSPHEVPPAEDLVCGHGGMTQHGSASSGAELTRMGARDRRLTSVSTQVSNWAP